MSNRFMLADLTLNADSIASRIKSTLSGLGGFGNRSARFLPDLLRSDYWQTERGTLSDDLTGFVFAEIERRPDRHLIVTFRQNPDGKVQRPDFLDAVRMLSIV